MKFNTGYSLIEMVIVISIFVLLMTVISAGIFSFYQSNEYAIQQSQAIASGREGIEVMVKDLRESTLSDEGDYPLVTLGEYGVEFYSDTDHDSNVEYLKYYINSDNQLIKETYKLNSNTYSLTATKILANYIRNETYERNSVIGVPMIVYFDEEGDQVTDYNNLDAVRYIKVELIVNVDPLKQPEEFVILSSANLRNLPVIE